MTGGWALRTLLFGGLFLCLGSNGSGFAELERDVASLKRERDIAPPGPRRQGLDRQVDEQLQRLERLGDQAPADGKLQADLAPRFLRLDEPDRALHRADLAVRLSPNDPAAHVVQAEAYYKLKRYDEAGGSARKALELDPESRSASAVSLLAHKQTARNPLKADMLKGQRQAPPDQPEGAAAVRPAAFGASAGTAARADAEAALAEPPISGPNAAAERAKAREMLGHAQKTLELGDHAAAIAALDKLVTLRPNDPRPYALRAKALLTAAARHGDAASAGRAVEDARRAAALVPESAPGRLLLAQALEASGAPRAEAEAAYLKAAELDPAFGSHHTAALARWARAEKVDGAAAAALSAEQALRRRWPWLAAAFAAAFALLIWRLMRRLR